MARRRITTGISFRVGRRSYVDPFTAFGQVQKQANVIRKHLGDLTRPFDEISQSLLLNIKARFDTGELGEPPYRESGIKRSRFTKAARRARGTQPEGPTLKQTGRLQKAIHRVPSPTKAESGGQREVYRLVIGVNSSIAPYYKQQFLGGVWEVPIREGPRGGRYFDPDRFPDASMSSAQFWGPRWTRLSSLPESTTEVQIPPTEFLYLSPDDAAYTKEIILRWAEKVVAGTYFEIQRGGKV